MWYIENKCHLIYENSTECCDFPVTVMTIRLRCLHFNCLSFIWKKFSIGNNNIQTLRIHVDCYRLEVALHHQTIYKDSFHILCRFKFECNSFCMNTVERHFIEGDVNDCDMLSVLSNQSIHYPTRMYKVNAYWICHIIKIS